MAAIFVYIRKVGGAWKCLALGRVCKLQTCPPHFPSLALPRRILLPTVYFQQPFRQTNGNWASFSEKVVSQRKLCDWPQLDQMSG